MYQLPVQEFTDKLASSQAVPGGGGASALAGALGAALGEMVGALTVGKKKYAAVEEEIKELMGRANDIRARLLEAINRDAAAFEPLSRAYGIPKDSPGRDETMEQCLRAAAEPPMEILRLCCEMIELHAGLAEKGSLLAISDAATGAVLCRGALQGAAVNVKVNTRPMKDRAYAQSINSEVDALVAKYEALAEDIYRDVCGRVC